MPFATDPLAALRAAAICAATAAFVAAAVTGPIRAEAVSVDVARHGVWTTEIVARSEGGGAGRMACAAFTGPEAGPRIYLSFTSEGAGAPGALAALIFRESAAYIAATRIGGAAAAAADVDDADAGARDDLAFIFSNGVVVGAEDLVGGDEDGATADAYPDPARAPEIFDAMRVSKEMRLTRGRKALHAMPLSGFDAAYARIAKACRFAPPKHG